MFFIIVLFVSSKDVSCFTSNCSVRLPGSGQFLGLPSVFVPLGVIGGVDCSTTLTTAGWSESKRPSGDDLPQPRGSNSGEVGIP